MPFTLFCHQGSPEQAHQFFHERNAVLEGDQDEWTASYQFDAGPPAVTIQFRYERQWCSPPNWPKQMQGMQGYLMQFPMGEALREQVMELVGAYGYSIAIVSEPEIESGDDPRLEVIHALAEELNATVFTPGALLDSQFRAFAAADGEVDDNARMPSLDGASASAGGAPSPPPIEAPEVESTDDDYDVDPPDARRVALRMYSLLAVAARGLLEMNLSMGNTPAYTLDELHQWTGKTGIKSELEPREYEVILRAASELPQQEVMNAVWRLEGLVVLAWALGLAEIPAYDGLVETDDLLARLSLLDANQCQANIAAAQLRPRDELDAYGADIFAFHWRMVDFRVRPEAIDYASVSIHEPFDLNWARLNDGDLEIGDRPIAAADPEHVDMAGSIAQERHLASYWLEGQARYYSDVAAHT